MQQEQAAAPQRAALSVLGSGGAARPTGGWLAAPATWLLERIGLAKIGLAQLGVRITLLREYWQVQRVSRRMLGRFRAIVRSKPRLDSTEAYRLLVQDHMHCDSRAADRILLGATQSFAVWPEDRDLQLRDVIHYVAVTEYLQHSAGSRGMRSDVQAVVNAMVPGNL